MTLPVRDFIIQRLLEFDPNFDTGNGVPTTGLMIDPQSIILQPIIDELTAVQASQSILTILGASDPDAFPEDIVDGLASNAFVERIPGAIGSTVERVRFFEPQDFSSPMSVLIWRGPAGQRYSNSEPVSVTSAEMALNQDGSLFYVDIPIIALDQGADYNVDAGAITTMEAEPQGVANVTNLFAVGQGRDRETNTQLIDRIKVAVTVRALVTGRGIIVTLTENFTTIEEIQPIGFHDPEMMRDIVYNVHIGGNVDVYVKTGTFTPGSKDIFGLEVDTTRQRVASDAIALLVQSVEYSLSHGSIDRTNVAPTVMTVDGLGPFTEGADYAIDDADGLIARLPVSAIFHVDGTGGVVSTGKTLTKTGAFAGVRTGMILTVDNPADVAGTYTVKDHLSNNAITIYGNFSVTDETGVDFHVDDNLMVTYEYNPISVDIIKTVRSVDRTDYTITDTPIMDIDSIQVLDSLSGNPTGAVLNGAGGFGAGGFGEGGFGVGEGADYVFVVTQSTLRFSWNEDNYIEFDDSLVGTAVRVNYEVANEVPPIQAFMDDRDNQSQSASLLAREFIPVFVDSVEPLVYTIATSTSATAISVDDMTTLVKQLIDATNEGDALEISDIVDLLYNNGARRVDLGSAQALLGEIHNEDGTVVFVSPNTAGDLAIPDDPIPDPTDRPLSPRIARFRSRNITLQRNLV
jgi:hypothetical protein